MNIKSFFKPSKEKLILAIFLILAGNLVEIHPSCFAADLPSSNCDSSYVFTLGIISMVYVSNYLFLFNFPAFLIYLFIILYYYLVACVLVYLHQKFLQSKVKKFYIVSIFLVLLIFLVFSYIENGWKNVFYLSGQEYNSYKYEYCSQVYEATDKCPEEHCKIDCDPRVGGEGVPGGVSFGCSFGCIPR